MAAPSAVGGVGPIQVTIVGTGYTGGNRVAYLLAAFAAVLLGLAVFDAVFPDSGGWSSVALWAGTGMIFLVTADASGLGYTLAREGPAELTAEGFAAPFFRYSDFRPGRGGTVLRSRIFRLPLARAPAPNRVDWSLLVVRVALDNGRSYLELWPLKGAPFRSLLTGVRSTLPTESLASLALRLGLAGGDLHVAQVLLTDLGRAAARDCPHAFRSDGRFGICLRPPSSLPAAAAWFVETAPRDPRSATTAPVEGTVRAERTP